MELDSYFVVGSGPAGVACAQALADNGRPVTILDTGISLEPEREQKVASIASRPQADWLAEELAYLQTPISPDGQVPLKLAYGSDYPYRTVSGSTQVIQSGLRVRGSYAAGGLSNVWGSVILPYRQHDLAGWPISEAELAPAYARVLEFMPIAAQRDELAERFPLYTDSCVPLATSRQAAGLLSTLKTNEAKLDRNHVQFGRSRLAVDARGRVGGRSCISCGLCLHGCPYRLIYSSADTLRVLRRRGRVRYLPGHTVQRIEEADDRVRIFTQDQNGGLTTFDGARVFLGTGVINTTAILLRSLELYDHAVAIKDSQYFLFPAFLVRGTPGVMQEPLHTLCQAFIQMTDPAISRFTVNLQVYTYNDTFKLLLRNKFGRLSAWMPHGLILGRLLLFQSYLHSSHSGQIRVTLRPKGSSDALHLEQELNPATKKKVSQVIRKLERLVHATGFMPLRPLVEIKEPGGGFHLGGSFPMAAQVAPGETDRWGRPFCLSRTHVIDATVFPTIPATTITFSVMANAYRIGEAAARRGDAL
jgi:choline dehydrogenase-like flavoprotein